MPSLQSFINQCGGDEEKGRESRNRWYRDYRVRNNEAVIGYGRKWKKSHPVKLKAESLVQTLVRAGKIKRKPCAVCGKGNTVAHHPNYRKPLLLVFLCPKDHRNLHWRTRKGAAK